MYIYITTFSTNIEISPQCTIKINDTIILSFSVSCLSFLSPSKSLILKSFFLFHIASVNIDFFLFSAELFISVYVK